MSYEFNLTVHKDHIYGEAVGRDSLQTSTEIFTQLKEACDKHEIYNVLVISKMTPVSTIEAYNFANALSDIGWTNKYRIAWVDENTASQTQNEFIETVLKNRGSINGFAFHIDQLDKAKEWLFYNENPKSS